MLLWGEITKYSKFEEMFDTLKRRGITTAQFHLMLILASRGDEWTSMQDLVSKMQKTRNTRVGQSAVSRAIKNLTATNRYGKDGHDMLETKSEEKDARYLHFRLNRRGLAFVDKLTHKI
jgi:DNA-binding MarR family transcriptional regulator